MRGEGRLGPSLLGSVTIAALVVLAVALAAGAGRKSPPPQGHGGGSAAGGASSSSQGQPVGSATAATGSGMGHTPVTLCHATGSARNPYVLITIDDDGVLGSGGSGNNGHDGHGRDIIPPFTYVDNKGVARSYPGKNWDAAGQAILANGCKPPAPPPPQPPPPPPPKPPKPPAPPPTQTAPSPAPTPTPTQPATVIDLAVTKVDTPDPVHVGATLTYTITVTNRGPGTATDVRLVDPLPDSVVALSVDPSRGSCVLSPVFGCTLGTLAPNETATIVVRVRPTQTGRLVNTATAVGAEAEASPADNAATAVTTVVGATRPPVKPAGKPRVKGAICLDHDVTPLSIRVGRSVRLWVAVSAAGKPVARVRVLVVGAGARTASTTNRRGVAVIRVRATRSGFLKVSLIGRNACRDVRLVGVTTPVLLPPVTG